VRLDRDAAFADCPVADLRRLKLEPRVELQLTGSV